MIYKMLGNFLLKGLTQLGGTPFAPYPSNHSAWNVDVIFGAPAPVHLGTMGNFYDGSHLEDC